MTLDSIASIARLAQRPALFERGEPMWDDPYISHQMLKFHLDPQTDAASRRPEVIERTVNWILDRLKLPLMSDLIDLGCGPGLYCERFARRGLNVTGVDFSANSIAYARKRAAQEGQQIDYRVQNYVEWHETSRYDAAVLIYWDFGVLSNADRDTVLANIWLALRPGGRFVFDVVTPHNRPLEDSPRSWSIYSKGGFWRPRPHLELAQTFHYPEAQAFVDQYVIVEDGGKASVYRNWEHYYTIESLRPALERAGFLIEDVVEDLTGTPLQEKSPSIGIVARKV